MTEAARFFAALRFLTRLPTSASVTTSADDFGRATRYMPLIGILVGGVGALVTWLAAWVLPISMAILFGMAATVLTTGAMHEDGFADSCDGFGGGWSKEQTLAIMKDSRIGTYGALGLGLMLIAKWDALYELEDELLLAAIVAAHAMSRLAAVLVMYVLDYARGEDGKSAAVAVKPNGIDLALAVVFGFLPCLLLPWQFAGVGVIVVTVVTWFAARYFERRLGGYTGDCLGAVQQVTELGFYTGLLCAFT